jgi:diaminopimelate decarboxylase
MNDLLRPSLYGAAHPVEVLAPGEDSGGADDGPVDVVGPICESGDFLALGRPLPGASTGALLAIGMAGAYGFVMSSNYNSRPRAAEVLSDSGRWAVVRDREAVDDVMRGERTLDEVVDAWQTAEWEKA